MHIDLHNIHRTAFFLLFMLGFVVRLIPEVLSYPYPIGFDTVFYAIPPPTIAKVVCDDSSAD